MSSGKCVNSDQITITVTISENIWQKNAGNFLKNRIATIRNKKIRSIAEFIVNYFRFMRTNLPLLFGYDMSDLQDYDTLAQHIKLTNSSLQISKTLFEQNVEQINNIQEYLSKLESDTNAGKYNAQLDEIIQLAEKTLTQHIQLSDTLLNIIINKDIKSIIDLITFNKIKDIIEELKIVLYDYETFLFDNIRDIIISSEFDIKTKTDELTIIMKIPIINKVKHQVFKPIAIPVKHGEEITRLITSNIYIIVSPTKEIKSIGKTEYSNCRIIMNNTVCSIHRFDNKTICEISQFRQEKSNECTREILTQKSIVTSINENTFHVCTLSKIEMTIKCEGKSIYLNIKDHLLFKLNAGCTLIGLDREYLIPKEENINTTYFIDLPKTQTLKSEKPEIKNIRQISFEKINVNNTFFELSKQFSNLYNVTKIKSITTTKKEFFLLDLLPDFPWYAYIIIIVLILSMISKIYKVLLKKLF